MKLNFWPFGKKKLPASADASSSSAAEPADSNVESRTNGENSDVAARKGDSNSGLSEDALYPYAQWTFKQAVFVLPYRCNILHPADNHIVRRTSASF